MKRLREEFTVPPTHPDYEVVTALNKFFRRKAWYNGGPIPTALLHTKQNYQVVRNADMDRAIRLGYARIEMTLASHGRLAKTQLPEKKGKKKDEKKEVDESNVGILIALRVLHQCGKLDIRQDYIPGIFLLYLQLCENVDLH